MISEQDSKILGLRREIMDMITMSRYGLESEDLFRYYKNRYEVEILEDIISSLEEEGLITIEEEEVSSGVFVERYFIK